MYEVLSAMDKQSRVWKTGSAKNIVVKVSLIEKQTVEQRLEGYEGIFHFYICKEHLSQRKEKC